MITFEFEYEAPVLDECGYPVVNDDGEQETRLVKGEFEANDDAFTDYEFVADVLMADEDPKAMIRCFRTLFNGKDREYARAIGGKLVKMAELLKAAIDAAGEDAKN